MTKQKAIADLTSFIERADPLATTAFNSDWEQWRSEVEAALRYIFKNNPEHVEGWNSINYSLGVAYSGMPANASEMAFRGGVRSAKAFLQARLAEVERYWDESQPSDAAHSNAVNLLYARAQALYDNAKRTSLMCSGQSIHTAADLFNSLLADAKKAIPIEDIQPVTHQTSWRNFDAITGQLAAIIGTQRSTSTTLNALQLVEELCNRFSTAAHELTKRYDNRSPFEITDEYDVQDLMHAFLRLSFDDVRPEEYTPSYAGSSSRMDFLMKDENLVVETKMTRNTLKTKELSTQIILDKERYRSHPICKALVFFVFDPKRLITNPRGLEGDLSDRGSLEVRVFIRH